jgi:hypothetical protein
MLEKIYKTVEVKFTWNISNARELKSYSELKANITTIFFALTIFLVVIKAKKVLK